MRQTFGRLRNVEPAQVQQQLAVGEVETQAFGHAGSVHVRHPDRRGDRRLRYDARGKLLGVEPVAAAR